MKAKYLIENIIIHMIEREILRIQKELVKDPEDRTISILLYHKNWTLVHKYRNEEKEVIREFCAPLIPKELRVIIKTNRKDDTILKTQLVLNEDVYDYDYTR